MRRNWRKYALTMTAVVMATSAGCAKNESSKDVQTSVTQATEKAETQGQTEINKTTEIETTEIETTEIETTEAESTETGIQDNNDNGISVTSEKKYEGQLPKYTVSYSDAYVGKIMLLNFDWEGHSYELCLSGIPKELNSEQINTLLGGFIMDEPVTVAAEQIVDAEKKSNKLYGELGDFVFKNDDREDSDWGDNVMCWAASTADMLFSSGWAQLAAEKNSELTFEDEDDVFKFFKKKFMLCGNYQLEGLTWFFEGGEHYGASSTDGYLSGVNVRDYLYGGPFDHNEDLENVEPITLSEVTDYLEILKTGGAVGIDVLLISIVYPLKSDPETFVCYDEIKDVYYESSILMIDDSDERIMDSYYCFNTVGDIVKLEKVDEQYVDASGNSYDPINVLFGSIFDLGNGSYERVNGEEGGLFCDNNIEADKDDIDFENEMKNLTMGKGGHAVTVAGYIMDKSADNKDDMVKAMFITDSDDDASIYVFTDDNYDETKRRNCTVMYNTETVKATETINTLNIKKYMPRTYTLITNLCALKKAEK